MPNRELISWRDVGNIVLAALAITLVVCGGAYFAAGGPVPTLADAAVSAHAQTFQPAERVNLQYEQVRQKLAAAVSPVTVHQMAAVSRLWRVHPGDTLGKISARFYGSSRYWTGIYWENKHTIRYANVIYVGQVLTIPATPSTPAAPRVLAPAPPPQPHRFVVTNHSTGSIPQPTVVTGGQSQQSTASGQLTPGQVGALWVEAGGPAWAEPAAEAVANCESGDNTNAYNPSGASGLWQILGSVVGGNLFNGYTNTLNAVAKFKAAGNTWNAWVCKPWLS